MVQTNKSARLPLLAAMCIFGSIGLVRKFIDLPSSVIALARALIGTGFLLILLAFQRRKIDFSGIRKNLIYLLLSSVALGFNWILLFEAYCYTTVATATLCYYMAPILVILVASVLFQEKLTVKKLICSFVALVGIVLVSGVLDTGMSGASDFRGILLGLGAAALYATVVLLNKKITGLSALERTVMQLAIAGIILLPYTLFTEDWSAMHPGTVDITLLIVAGIVHTGIAYALYFGSISTLPSPTVALYSYIDPILAIVLSALFLQEPITVGGAIGAVLILGAAYISDRE